MKKILKSFWLVIIAPILVTIIGGLILTRIEDVKFLEGVTSFILLIWNFAKSILSYSIPVWVIILIIGALFMILLFISKFKALNQPRKISWYEDYNEEKYKGVLYSWDYVTNYGEVSIKHLRPICQKCKGELTEAPSSRGSYRMYLQLFCPNCDKETKTPTSEELKIAEVFIYNKLKQREKLAKEGRLDDQS